MKLNPKIREMQLARAKELREEAEELFRQWNQTLARAKQIERTWAALDANDAYAEYLKENTHD